VRAYAINATGTSYSNEVAFTTLAATVPSISSLTTSSVTQTSLSASSLTIADGGSTIIQKGFVWSTSTNPTIALTTKIISNDSSNSISASITGLSPATTYYIRAFATNSQGTAYSIETTFTTLAFSVPSITNLATNSITQTGLNLSGKINNEGGSTITQKGFVWSTNPNPTIALSTKSYYTYLFSNMDKAISGLLASTTYYVRAFATNATGTGYSQEITFTTLAASAPSISAIDVSNITQTGAIFIGLIRSDGDSAITQKGFVWSTSPNPNIALTTKSIDTNMGNNDIVKTITGLSPATTYYLRAFATNALGTSYSLETAFTTSP
jgi:hypothetical protein